MSTQRMARSGDGGQSLFILHWSAFTLAAASSSTRAATAEVEGIGVRAWVVNRKNDRATRKLKWQGCFNDYWLKHKLHFCFF